MNALEYIAKLSLFARLEDATLRVLSAAAKVHRHCPPGGTIFQPGDRVEELFILANLNPHEIRSPVLVHIDMPVTNSGKAIHVGRIVEGELFGDIEFLIAGLTVPKRPRITRAQTVTYVDLITLPIDVIAKVIGNEPILRQRLVREGSQRLLNTLYLQGNFRHGDMDVNLANFLVDLAADQGIFYGNYVEFRCRVAQDQIADDLGISRRTISEHLNQWSSYGLVQTTPFTLLDFRRIQRIAELRETDPLRIIDRTIREVDEFIDNGDLVLARNVALDLLRYFPASPELALRAALAAARQLSPDDARSILESANLGCGQDISQLALTIRRGLASPRTPSARIRALDFDHNLGEHDDWEDCRARVERRAPRLIEDISGLWARLDKDRYYSSADPDKARASARAAADGYKRSFEYTRKISLGINAATMAYLCGRIDNARELAQQVLRFVDHDDRRYWSLASVAEAQLLLGRTDLAKQALAEAATAVDSTEAAKAATRRQLRHLSQHLSLEPTIITDILRSRKPAVVAGYMLRPTSLGPSERNVAEEHIRSQADQLLMLREIGPLFGSLACGSDIILAEAALELGVEYHAVLPLPVKEFVAASVVIGDDPGDRASWIPRFERCLSGAASVTIPNLGMLRKRNFDAAFQHGFRYAAGRALARAQSLQTEAILIAVVGSSKTGATRSTQKFTSDWLSRGRRACLIDFPFEYNSTGEHTSDTAPFSAVVLIFPERGHWTEEKARQVCRVIRNIFPADCPILDRPVKSGHSGFAVVVPYFDSTATLTLQLLSALNAEDCRVRIICDFGSILNSALRPDPEKIARLDGASDLAGFPGSQVLAVGTFAMEALYRGSDHTFVSVGRRPQSDQERSSGKRVEPALDVFVIATQAAFK